MHYKIQEDELFEVVREAYLKGLRSEGTSNSVTEEIIRRLRDKIYTGPQSDVPHGYHWELISPDMLSATDEATYIQEMGVPPPIIVGYGPVTPDTPTRDLDGNFYRRKKE